MEIRTNLTNQDVIKNMLEIALFLSQQEDESNDIEVTVNNLQMHFEVYTIQKSGGR